MLGILVTLFYIGLVIRVLLRPHRDPTSRVAWIAVILALPVVGAVLPHYLEQ